MSGLDNKKKLLLDIQRDGVAFLIARLPEGKTKVVIEHVDTVEVIDILKAIGNARKQTAEGGKDENPGAAE